LNMSDLIKTSSKNTKIRAAHNSQYRSWLPFVSNRILYSLDKLQLIPGNRL
jgi:hypothetical protein